jgi:uncharacterized membrane protein YbhN (UPF0104 family)
MRTTLIRLIPWILTAGIFAIIFSRIPVPDVLAALKPVPLLAYLALMLPYSMIYCLIDTFVLSRAVAWFHQPIPYGRLLPVRASSYILSLLNPGLGQGGLAFYVHRREGITFFALAGTMLFLAVMEFSQLGLYAAIGIVSFYPHLAGAFAPFYAAFVAIIGTGLFMVHKKPAALERILTKFGSKLHPEALLNTFRQARPRHYVLIILYKAVNFLCAVVLHYFALQLFNIQVPFAQLFTSLPIIFLVASLPVTVAHLGTSQAAWLYFFADYPPSQILAYSLVAHVTFMLLNSLIGLSFLPLALRGLRHAAPAGDPQNAQPLTSDRERPWL